MALKRLFSEGGFYLKLTAEEVFVLKDKCSYGGSYDDLGKRLEYGKPKILRLSIYDLDLLCYWLEDDEWLSDTEKAIKAKLKKQYLDADGNYKRLINK